MEGGVNAFLRSRPPLDLPLRRAQPSAAVCRIVFRFGVGICSLLAATYGLSFAGFTFRSFGWLVIALALCGFIANFAVDKEPYWPRNFWRPPWPFKAGVPRWAQFGTIGLVLLFAGTVVSGTAFAGDPQVVEGGYVLQVKGEPAQQISAETYTRVCEAQVRFVSTWLLCIWFHAVGLWWCELDRVRTSPSEAVRPKN